MDACRWVLLHKLAVVFVAMDPPDQGERSIIQVGHDHVAHVQVVLRKLLLGELGRCEQLLVGVREANAKELVFLICWSGLLLLLLLDMLLLSLDCCVSLFGLVCAT